jgi:hypothetical protein
MPRTKRRLLGGLYALLSALVLSSCAYFPGSMTDLVPIPSDVKVQEPPQITSCSASFILSRCEDEYETVCGYLCRRWDWWWDCWRWYYCCQRYWVRKHCSGDISIKLTVNDPSNDLDMEKNPRVRVFDAEPMPGSAPNTCLLNIGQTDVAISSTDITESGPTKTVTVRIRNVQLTFTSQCERYASSLPLRIVFQDCGKEMASINECRASVEFLKP